eukprot:2732656-Amphidinium_carterae.1
MSVSQGQKKQRISTNTVSDVAMEQQQDQQLQQQQQQEKQQRPQPQRKDDAHKQVCADTEKISTALRTHRLHKSGSGSIKYYLRQNNYKWNSHEFKTVT